MPASETDEEAAQGLFGGEGNITEYIVELGFSVRNTTKSEVDAMHRGALKRGALSRVGAKVEGLQDKGAERKADRHKVQPE